MSFAWQSQAALTRSGTLGDWLLGFLKMLGGRCHHQLSRHAVSGSHPSLGKNPRTKPDPCGGSGGCGSRSRSKLAKRTPSSGFHRRSFSISQDTLSRRRIAIHLSKSFRFLSTPDPIPPCGEGMRQFSMLRFFDSVERKGFEPSTPGLQSRCSPS